MKRITILSMGTAAALALTFGFAFADDGAGTPPSDPTAKAAETVQTTANPQAEAHAGDVLAGIQERAAKLNAKAAAKWNAEIDAAAKETDAASAADERQVADRLGTEFGITGDALIAEKSDLSTSWGQLMIAHTLMANATADVTAKQLFGMKTQGMGWGQIAAGMGLRLGDAISAVKAEGRVAKGLDKPDGNVATIHGVGAKAGMGEAQAAAKAGAKSAVKSGATVGAQGAAGAAVETEHAKMGVGAGVGAGAGKSGK
jgi:hypothetical protein